MTPRLRTLAIAALAAATVTVGSVAAPPPAAAKPMSCATRLALSSAYIATGQVFQSLGQYQLASYWYGRSEGILTGC